MKRFRIRKINTAEWEVSPWWSSFFPFIYRSKSYCLLSKKEFQMTTYRERNGKCVRTRPGMEAEYWNGWLIKIIHKTKNKIYDIKSMRRRTEEDDIPF